MDLGRLLIIGIVFTVSVLSIIFMHDHSCFTDVKNSSGVIALIAGLP